MPPRKTFLKRKTVSSHCISHAIFHPIIFQIPKLDEIDNCENSLLTVVPGSFQVLYSVFFVWFSSNMQCGNSLKIVPAEIIIIYGLVYQK